jgi:hypothetical protein
VEGTTESIAGPLKGVDVQPHLVDGKPLGIRREHCKFCWSMIACSRTTYARKLFICARVDTAMTEEDLVEQVGKAFGF